MHYVKNIRIPVLTSITTRIQKDPYWEQQRLKLRNLRKDRVELQKDLASYSYPKEITEMFLAMMIGGPAGILSGLSFIYVYYKAFVRIPWIRYIKKEMRQDIQECDNAIMFLREDLNKNGERFPRK